MVTSCSLDLMYRIGFAEDIHELVEGRPLIIGGVHVPFGKGEKAHSDGDVLLHALSEALLGSLALGDLGMHFPDDQDDTLNMDSKLIMKKCYELVRNEGYELVNADISVVLEKPKLRKYIPEMREIIASILNTDVKNISVKVGTNEKMDAIGEGRAIKATATILVKRI